ncbi:MAG TPA: hypothetical protein VGE74_27515 [Gemmata sp.]
MAAVLDPKDTKETASKLGAQVDEQLAQATSRIRAHDLMFGGLVLVGLALVYTIAMVLLDKYLNLPQWVRQVSLLGFLGALAGTSYLTIVSPLRKKINPLYAAKQVESTIDDAKNSVTGYVDAQQRGTLNATVKAALATRAAKSVAEADVNKAVDHRSLVYLAGVAIALFLGLVVLFFLFRPSQFGSLIERTFIPFTSSVIKTRTQINLVKPDPTDPTITDGQTVLVAVHIGGKVPGADSPERVRLMVRHNPADPNFIEVPMVEGETTRDFEVRVPNHLVQNGFWYKVAAGDAETAEFKVSVRSLPLFTAFQATYEAPKYLRRKTDTLNSPIIKGYRGTTVTLVAQTNREAREGTLVIEPGGTIVQATTSENDPKSLQFKFKLQESGRYKLTYTTTDGERSAEPFQSTITVTSDAAPTLVIDKPEEEEVTLPTNGQLVIDGKVGDDFGIDTITLKMRLTGAAGRDLPDRPFKYGESVSFKRKKDGTWPTNVDYKDSVDFAALKKDAAGLNFELKPDMVLEYWLEATDNCTEPKANVGKSAVKRVRLAPPVVEEPKKNDLDQQKNDRKAEEQKHNTDQQQKLEQERREPAKNEQNPDQQPEGNPKPDNAKGAPKNADPMGNNPPKNDTNPGEPKRDTGMGGTGGMNDPMNTPKPTDMNDKGGNPSKTMNDPSMQQTDPNNMGMGTNPPNTAPPPKSPEDKDVQRKADELNKAIEQEKTSGGSAKNNATPSPDERTDPAQPKPQPKGDMGNTGGIAEPKPEPGTKADPMQKPESAPASGKSEGNLEKPADPSAPKPDAAKQPNNPMGGNQKNPAPSETRDEPLGAPSGAEKKQPEKSQPEPKDPNRKQDPNSGSTAKPSGGSDHANTPKPDEKRDPAAEAGSSAKPMPEPARGADKPNEPKGGLPDGGANDTQPRSKPDAKPNAGEAKPEKAPPAGATKPVPPKEDMMNPGAAGMPEAKPEGSANEPKPNGTGAAETKPTKPDEKNPPAGGASGSEKGEDKLPPKNVTKPGSTGGGGAGTPKDKPLSEQERKELEEAAKNLTSPDEKKKQAARDKLDKAIGSEKRKEMEKLANDLRSPDEKTRKDAERKLEELKQQAKKGGENDKPGEAPKLDEKQMKEIADAVKDLQSTDEQKKQAAQQKLDNMVGEKARKDAEQLMNDLKSDDKDTRTAAEQKVKDLQKEMEKRAADQNAKKAGGESAKGKDLSKEELADLMKKAKDLQSQDDKTRAQAEKDLDEKIGKQNREKLQEQLKNQKPGTPDEEQKLKDQMEQLAKDQGKKEHDPRRGGLGSGVRTKEAMEEDARNRLKTAELQLEQFEKKRYDEAFKKKQGFTDAEYEKFLRDYERHVEKLREDAKKGIASGDRPPVAGTPESGAPITPGGAGKIGNRPGTSSGTAGNTTVDVPGFDGARERFNKLINEKK